jgi:hypothetical protein
MISARRVCASTWTRARDQRGDRVVIVVVPDAQVSLGFGKRDRLDGGAVEENGGHGGLSLSILLALTNIPGQG